MTSLVHLDWRAPNPATKALKHQQLHNSVVTVGNFDGVHRGHQSLLRQCQIMAKRLGGIPVVAFTFDPHPAALLHPDVVQVPLTTMQTRVGRMEELGVGALVVCRTTAELLRLSPQDFFSRLLLEQLQVKGMVEGPNFYFGANRAGDIGTLGQLCQDNLVDFQVVRPADQDGQMISSSRLRGCLAAGDVSGFAELCGHRHRIEGIVIEGEQRGRTIGFPTANLGQIEVALPQNGVYAGFVWVDQVQYRAAIHLGPNPTFNEKGGGKVEIHLIDYDGNLYGKKLSVEFVDHVREIAKFDSTDELVAQLRRDIVVVRQRTTSNA